MAIFWYQRVASRDWRRNIALGRYGEPEQLGSEGAFLLSPAASYITGVSLQLDGDLVPAIPLR